METQTITNTKELVKIFAAAVEEKDFDLVESMLADGGVFQTQDAALETIDECSKIEFIKWFKSELAEIQIEKIEYDNCIFCKMGAPVVIFNGGKFPRVKLDSSGRSMNGLMLDINDGLIHSISFCYSFAVIENKHQFECNGEEAKKLVSQNPGMTFGEAITIVLKERGYKD